jgi:hypothetical protein
MAIVFLGQAYSSLGPKLGNVVSHRFFTVAIRIKYTLKYSQKKWLQGRLDGEDFIYQK